MVPVNPHNLKSAFHHRLKDKVEDKERSGIYSLNCKDCKKQYIGQTRRKMKIKIKEHHRNIKNKEVEKSAVAYHALNSGHKFEDSGKLSVTCSDRRKLNTLEWIEMYKKWEELVNFDLEGLNNCLFKFSAGNTEKFNRNPP